MTTRLVVSLLTTASSVAITFAGSVAASPPAAPATTEAQSPIAPSFGPQSADDASGPADDFVAGELAIDLRDDATAADIADLDARFHIDMHGSSAWSRAHDKLEIADVDPALEDALLADLARDPRVEHAEPMALYRETFVPNDPLYASKQWHLTRVGAEKAWGYSCGEGVTVAVVDTGIACFDKGPFSRGSDLAGTRCEGGWNFVDDTDQAYDDQGHGTHVAGTIAQTTNNGVGAAGLAFCATLMPVKVLSKGGFGSVVAIADGIRYAADEGAQVINLSLGGPIRSGILESAIQHALSRGVVVVAAAGNSGKSVGWPAAYPGVIAVSATDDQDKLAWFSSRGYEVSIAAPGVAVTQQTICNGGKDKCEIFGTFNGTSMASPHVAGAAAMIEALGVTRPSAVRDVLLSSARPPEADHNEKLFGAGILDVAAATARVFWGHFFLRLLGLAGLAYFVQRRVRTRGGDMNRGAGAIAGALFAGVGLAPFAPLLGLANQAGRLRTLVELAMRPLGEWDLVLSGAGLHRWLLLASALPAIGLAAFGFSSPRLRPFVGGVALGSAALLSQMAWSGDAAFVGGAFLARVWQIASALICLWLATVALETRRA